MYYIVNVTEDKQVVPVQIPLTNSYHAHHDNDSNLNVKEILGKTLGKRVLHLMEIIQKFG